MYMCVYTKENRRNKLKNNKLVLNKISHRNVWGMIREEKTKKKKEEKDFFLFCSCLTLCYITIFII
jgi:hypothetical protein